MIDLAEMNSRMKDFYDLYRLLSQHKYDSVILQQAILNTFQRRKTVYIENHSLFTAEFAQNEKRIIQWKSFLKKSTLDVNIDLKEVLQLIQNQLLPIYELLNQQSQSIDNQ
jgi:Nucleotidyl transferase AbiEii toxin, Type IV TA system